MAESQPTRTYDFVGNSNAVADEVDTEFNTLYTVLQGGIGDTHIAADAAVQFSKLQAAAWDTWIPAYTASASMTFTSVTTNVARYIKIGRIITYVIQATGTVGGTPDVSLIYTLPVAASTSLIDWSASAIIADGGTRKVGYAMRQSDTQGLVRLYDASNWSAGASRMILVTGTFESAA